MLFTGLPTHLLEGYHVRMLEVNVVDYFSLKSAKICSSLHPHPMSRSTIRTCMLITADIVIKNVRLFQNCATCSERCMYLAATSCLFFFSSKRCTSPKAPSPSFLTCGRCSHYYLPHRPVYCTNIQCMCVYTRTKQARVHVNVWVCALGSATLGFVMNLQVCLVVSKYYRYTIAHYWG